MSRTQPEVFITIVCEHCNSDNVVRDATASWDVESQTWVLCGVQDQGYCNDCDIGEVRLLEVEMCGACDEYPCTCTKAGAS